MGWAGFATILFVSMLGGVSRAAPAPDPPAVRRRVVLRGVKFGFASAKIDSSSRVILELVAEKLREEPEIRVRIEGHTSSIGPERINDRLSRRRAEAVRDALLGLGVASGRLEVAGRGERDPIASNDTPEGRALNQRVELLVLENDGSR